MTDEVHRVELFITNDPGHKSQRKIKIKMRGITGAIWVQRGEDYEELATKWISAVTGWPEHLIDAYNVNGCT
jgi:hypothetical protein